MTTPLDIIKGSLRAIGSLASGEIPDSASSNDALALMNDMLDQWSNQKLLVFAVQEVIHELTGGQYIYTIGPGGNVGCSFTGSVSGNVLTVSAIASGALSVGQVISGSGLASNISITSLGTGVGGNTTAAIGTYYLNTTASFVSGALTSSAPRPVRINSAFVRVSNSITGTLDFPVAVISYEDYETIGIKSLPGPWPRAVYYQPSEPLGVLNYWQNPSQGEMHLFCDSLLNKFNTLNDTITLPQGYNMALRWNLAELLMPEYGKNDPVIAQMITTNAAKSRGWIKSVNMKPQQMQRVDGAIVNGNPADSGWIMHGGFL